MFLLLCSSGMNVLAAPFLYTMPSEIEAFYCFSAFIEECCPLYVSPTLKGVHDGLAVSLLSSSCPPLTYVDLDASPLSISSSTSA